jgi:hypothetical protein
VFTICLLFFSVCVFIDARFSQRTDQQWMHALSSASSPYESDPSSPPFLAHLSLSTSLKERRQAKVISRTPSYSLPRAQSQPTSLLLRAQHTFVVTFPHLTMAANVISDLRIVQRYTRSKKGKLLVSTLRCHSR